MRLQRERQTAQRRERCATQREEEKGGELEGPPLLTHLQHPRPPAHAAIAGQCCSAVR